jgi:hypothetical protein
MDIVNMKKQSFWILDFEASGLSKESYPIEVGLSNGEVNFGSLIKPLPDWKHWCEKAESIHNIKREFLLTEGEQAFAIANRLNNLIQYDEVYCDSLEWDGFWLNVLFSSAGLTPYFKLKDVRELLQEGTKITQYLAIKKDLEDSGLYTLHRALDDARLIYRCLSIIK